MTDGRRTIASNIADARGRVADGLASLPDEYKKLREPARYPVSVSDGVTRLEQQIRNDISAGQAQGV